MSKIDISAWKKFPLGKLFHIEKGTRLTKANMKVGDINFIGASSFNNGVTAKIGNIEHLHPANTITVSYNGSVGETFYQTQEYWASDDVNVLYPNFALNEYIALFLLPIIKLAGQQYAFIDKWKKEDMEKDSIPLPANIDGDPDWGYMETYIKDKISTYKSNIQTLTAITPPRKIEKIHTCDWGNFKVSELFEIHNGKGITKNEIFAHPGDIPAIQSGEENYGCIGYLDKDYCVQQKYSLSKGMCLTVARSGSSGYVGYQSEQCVVGDSAKVLEPKFVANKERLLFLQTVLLQLKPMYAYSDKVTTDNYSKQIIKLPITAEGKPDWNYMENTIRNIMYNSEQYIKAINYA